MKEKKMNGMRRVLVIVLGAAVYALLFGLCSQVDRTGTCSLPEAGRRFLLALPIALAVMTGLMAGLFPLMERGLKGKEPEKRFCTAGAFALIFCAFVPMFLIEYPGSFTYNTQDQVVQFASGEFTLFHPLIHTLLLGSCLTLFDVFQSYEKCAAIYSLVQMALLSGCFALTAASLSRSSTRRTARLATTFFCLYPTHWLMASNCTKDVLFTGFFVLFLAYALEMMRAGTLSPLHSVLAVASGTLACLFRNNMIYAMSVWLIVLAVWGLRRHMRLALYTLLAIVLALGTNSGLRAMTGASEGKMVEMLSVPIQQLARARQRADEQFTPEERELMDSLFENQCYQHYTPSLSDPVKDRINDALLQEKKDEAVKLWLSVGKKCPEIYLDAFLELALPSLYPYREYKSAALYLEAGAKGGVIASIYEQPPIVQPGRFAGVRDWLEVHFFNDGADDVPIVREFFNTGSVFWLLLALFLYSVYQGDGKKTEVLMLGALLWGTFVLGPVMQGRYLYPFVSALPVFIGVRKKA